MNAVTFFRKQENVFKLLVASQESYVIYDYQKQVVSETIISSSNKKKNNPSPVVIDISFDD